MTALEIVILMVLGSIALLVLLRQVLGWKLRKENKKLKEELHRMKEMRKHRGFHLEREGFEPSEEYSEAEGYPSSPVMDEEDIEEE